MQTCSGSVTFTIARLLLINKFTMLSSEFIFLPVKTLGQYILLYLYPMHYTRVHSTPCHE